MLAAASMQDALDAVADAWAAEGHPRPVLSFAGTSALARQVEAGAPADLFISADEKWMDELSRKDLVRPGSRVNLLANSLVLIAPAGKPVSLDATQGFPLAQALNSGSGRLAMADPEAVPAGRYGKQALTSLGVWDEVSDKVVAADNVRAALALVGHGEVPFGIVYATDALADPGVQVVTRFPASSHEPIRYPLAVLKSASNPDTDAFRAFLLSADAAKIFKRFGFETASDR